MAIPPLKHLVITDWFYTDDWFRYPFVGIVVCGLVFEAWVTSGFSNYDSNGRIEATSLAPRIGNAVSALFRYALCGLFCGFIGRLMHNSSRQSEFIRKQCKNPKKFGKWRMDQLHHECEKYTGNFCNAERVGNRGKCNSELIKTSMAQQASSNAVQMAMLRDIRRAQGSRGRRR